MSYVLVPVSATRITQIEGQTSRAALIGGLGYWSQYAVANGIGTLGNWHQTGDLIYDAVERNYSPLNPATRTLGPALWLSPRPWGAVSSTLISMCALASDTTRAQWTGHTWRLPTQCDHCSGYAAQVEADSLNAPLWLVVQTSGDEMTWGSASTPVTSFALGTVLYEGTYGDALAYRDAL